jgi:hypothetical protein
MLERPNKMHLITGAFFVRLFILLTGEYCHSMLAIAPGAF